MPVLPEESPTPAPGTFVPWVAAEDLSCTSPCSIDSDVLARAASIIADNLSGHRYGQREIRLRPNTLSPHCGCEPHGFPWGFGLLGLWTPFGMWSTGCGCGRVTSLVITEPVNAVASVKVDGATIDASAWVLYGDNRLVRVDGGTFPCCQDIRRDPDTDFGTLEVRCTLGAPPDEAAQMAVQEIACEMLKAVEKPETCRLPRRVQSLTRQQLSVSFPNPSNAYSEGFTDLPLVDLWLSAMDADIRRRPGRAVDFSRMTTWRAPAS